LSSLKNKSSLKSGRESFTEKFSDIGEAALQRALRATACLKFPVLAGKYPVPDLQIFDPIGSKTCSGDGMVEMRARGAGW
jgi:hypothetical protein